MLMEGGRRTEEPERSVGCSVSGGIPEEWVASLHIHEGDDMAGKQRLNVLVIDPDEATHLELKDLLSADGYQVHSLGDPEQVVDGLELLGESLALGFVPGIIVDPNGQLLGLDRIDFSVIGEYPRHPVTHNLSSLSLFPRAQGLEFYGDDRWQRQNFLQSDARSWSETGELVGEVSRGDDDDEISGPLTIGMSLARQQEREGLQFEQRVVIVGDADFLSNRYLGNGANLDIGVNLINWLSHDDRLISISPRPAPDTRLELSTQQQLAIAIFFLFALPLGLLVSGLRIWLKRRKR